MRLLSLLEFSSGFYSSDHINLVVGVELKRPTVKRGSNVHAPSRAFPNKGNVFRRGVTLPHHSDVSLFATAPC